MPPLLLLSPFLSASNPELRTSSPVPLVRLLFELVAVTLFLMGQTKFQIEFEQEEDGRWIAEVSDLSGVLAYGATREEALSSGSSPGPSRPGRPPRTRRSRS